MFQVDSIKLRDLMFARKINIAGLARSAKITEKTVANLLNGSKANAKTVGKISAALNCEGKDLIVLEKNQKC